MRCEFTIPGDPVGDQRPRVTRSGVTYKPDGPSRWKSDALAVIGQLDGLPKSVTGPLRVSVLAVMKRPQRLQRKKDWAGRIWAADEEKGSKPDGDNVLKLVQDTLVHAGVLRDDTFVCHGSVLKVYQGIREHAEPPHVEVVIERLGALNLGDMT